MKVIYYLKLFNNVIIRYVYRYKNLILLFLNIIVYLTIKNIF